MVGEPMLHGKRFRDRPCCQPIASRSVTLPTVAMAAAAAAVPTFSWTYKAGQRQRPLLLCPEHFSRRGHLGGGAPPAEGCHFSQLSNGQGHGRGRGGGLTFLWTWGRPALTLRGKRLTDSLRWSAVKWKHQVLQRNRTIVGWDIVCRHTDSHPTFKKMNAHEDGQAQIVDFSWNLLPPSQLNKHLLESLPSH